MAEILDRTALDTREARSRLATLYEQYWLELSASCHLGYYFGEDMRIWTARFIGKDRQPLDRRIGFVDDKAVADGIDVLTFAQAERAAWNWHGEQTIRQAHQPMDDSPFNKIGAACGRI